MHPVSSDVQMGHVLTSTGNVMERMTAKIILMNRAVVIFFKKKTFLFNKLCLINRAVMLIEIHFSAIASGSRGVMKKKNEAFRSYWTIAAGAYPRFL